ncbi:hypothetical protein KPL37_13345 [Clostridium frigoris]|uniref:Uncharacterized protein n=1 Tax=Clostridium frigoris TaxID=205327 RepID=A0ABS6BUY1_9CLOT|nr:hypothetical protein [Clostridium frigoris]MBU3160729.1 hypothetical protein [Clostridium frigoris]
MKHEKGLIVIVGCFHIGIVNILERIIEHTNMTIYVIIKETHLVEVNEKRLKNTINYFKEKNISLLAMSHCTGKVIKIGIKQVDIKEITDYVLLLLLLLAFDNNKK